MTTEAEQILKRPIVTEKSTVMAGLSKYTFEIPTWATKNHVREAFKAAFPKSKVLKVNIGKIYGKQKRTSKGRTLTADRKKAIVTCEGDHIDYFPEI